MPWGSRTWMLFVDGENFTIRGQDKALLDRITLNERHGIRYTKPLQKKLTGFQIQRVKLD